MTKKELDVYFTNNWTFLTEKATDIHINLRGVGDASDLVQEAYMEILGKLSKVTIGTVESYFVRFCSSQLQWSNSKHNRRFKPTAPHIRYESYVKHEGPQDDMDMKIEIEKWYGECMGWLEIYRLKSKHNKILLDLFIELEGSNRKISDRLNISMHTAWKMVNKMKDDIKYLKETTTI